MSLNLESMFSLKGRRALITGGGRGIGRSISLAFAGAGAEVCIHYNRNADAAEDTARIINSDGGKAFTAAGNLAEKDLPATLCAAVDERWGALDILVNNAGHLVDRIPIENTDDDFIDQVLQVNLHGTVRLTRDMLPLLRQGQRPSIINITSIAAYTGGAAGVTIYATSKGAIGSFTRGMALELAPDIRVNAIAPGVIITDLHLEHSSPERLEQFAAKTPLKRNGHADDCAGAAVFLAAAAGEFVTGETIDVNGGLLMR